MHFQLSAIFELMNVTFHKTHGFFYSKYYNLWTGVLAILLYHFNFARYYVRDNIDQCYDVNSYSRTWAGNLRISLKNNCLRLDSFLASTQTSQYLPLLTGSLVVGNHQRFSCWRGFFSTQGTFYVILLGKPGHQAEHLILIQQCSILSTFSMYLSQWHCVLLKRSRSKDTLAVHE